MFVLIEASDALFTYLLPLGYFTDRTTAEMEEEPVAETKSMLELSEELKAGFARKDIVHQLISEEL